MLTGCRWLICNDPEETTEQKGASERYNEGGFGVVVCVRAEIGERLRRPFASACDLDYSSSLVEAV
jgi:hypothetical protein